MRTLCKEHYREHQAKIVLQLEKRHQQISSFCFCKLQRQEGEGEGRGEGEGGEWAHGQNFIGHLNGSPNIH